MRGAHYIVKWRGPVEDCVNLMGFSLDKSEERGLIFMGIARGARIYCVVALTEFRRL